MHAGSDHRRSVGNMMSDGVHDDWRQHGGHDLEASLCAVSDFGGDNPVRLVDARFLVGAADRGETLRRRQDLPHDAFISLERLKSFDGFHPGLRIIVISHPWLQPDHPDPHGSNLRLLARPLRALLASSGAHTTFAVFLDFVSLHQKDGAGIRTASEQALFARALDSLATWYSHPATFLFKITSLPDGYPSGFSFPAGVQPNQADYYGRGWCFTESSVGNLVKPFTMVYDLAKLSEIESDELMPIFRACTADSRRAAPLTPEAFDEQLESKSFTSRSADLERVSALYRGAFERRLGRAAKLSFSQLAWGDDEARALSRVLASGALRQLHTLELGGNAVGDAGMCALADAIRSGGMPLLIEVDLHANPASDGPVQAALADAIASRSPVNPHAPPTDPSDVETLLRTPPTSAASAGTQGCGCCAVQ